MDFLEIIKNNDKEALEAYLKTHDVNEEINGYSLIFWTVYLGNLEFTELLIEKGAKVDKKDSLGRTLLSIAAFFGFVDVSRLLLENGAPIDNTAIYRAQNGWDGHTQVDILNLFREYQ